MKRVLWISLIALALPAIAFAGSTTDYGNVGGTLTGTSAGLVLSGSELTSINSTAGTLGTVSFSTGALTSGTLSAGATFAAGGTFTIDVNGGPDFTGTFSSPVSWTLMGTAKGGAMTYQLYGTISGTWSNGTAASGWTYEEIFTSAGGFSGKLVCTNGSCISGDTFLTSAVPEPGTLGLLGTGLVGLAGVLRRKLRA